MKTKNLIVGAKSSMVTLSFSKVASPCHSEKGNEITFFFNFWVSPVYFTNIYIVYFLSGRGITLQDPDNIIIPGKLGLSQISIFEIHNPKRGAWTLTVSGGNGGHEFFVKSSSATNVDFEHYFLVEMPGRGRRMVEVPTSNPIIGKWLIFFCCARKLEVKGNVR